MFWTIAMMALAGPARSVRAARWRRVHRAVLHSVMAASAPSLVCRSLMKFGPSATVHVQASSRATLSKNKIWYCIILKSKEAN